MTEFGRRDPQARHCWSGGSSDSVYGTITAEPKRTVRALATGIASPQPRPRAALGTARRSALSLTVSENRLPPRLSSLHTVRHRPPHPVLSAPCNRNPCRPPP